MQQASPFIDTIADCSGYICPETHRPLRQEGQFLVTSDHSRRFPIERGIPNFNRHVSVESGDTAAELTRLNDLARKNGCHEAIQEVYKRTPEMIRYVTELGRGLFLEQLPLTAQTRVLEIGPGLGQFTTLLAERAESVHVLEVVKQQAQFVEERCRQSQVANVTVACGGDVCQLPYADQSFDLVVLNLVLEWCGSRDSSAAADTLQRRMLGEIKRVLKPGGQVFLATKNRYALRYLLGGRDEHCHNLRFGSALPGFLASALLALLGRPRAAGRLYSWRGLQLLLAETGLEVVQSLWAAPEMRYPSRYIETSVREIRSARSIGGFSQGETRTTAFVMRLLPPALVKHLMPGLVFLARRPAQPQTPVPVRTSSERSHS